MWLRNRRRRGLSERKPDQTSQAPLSPRSARVEKKPANKSSTSTSSAGRDQPRSSQNYNATMLNTSYIKRIDALDIVLDIGARDTKATFRIHFPSHKDETPDLRDVEVITWPNHQTSIWTQLAIDSSESIEGHMVWGVDVVRLLEDGDITHEDIQKNFKQALFDPEQNPVKKLNKITRHYLKEKQAPQDPSSLINCDQDSDDETDNREITTQVTHNQKKTELRIIEKDAFLLYSEYVRQTIGYIERKICEYQGAIIDQDTQIRVGFPLPAIAEPHHICLVMAAAKAAGIRNPVPMSEPAAALLFHLSSNPRQEILGKAFIVVDAGALSVDLQAWKILEVKPLKVADVAVAESVFCGGNTINDRAVHLILSRIMDLPSVLASMGEIRNCDITKTQFEYEIRKEFEQKKKYFDGTRGVRLEIPLVPNDNLAGMTFGKGIQLSCADLEQIFQPTVVEINSAIDAIFGKIKDNATLVLSGGTMQSAYIQNQIRRHINSRYAGKKYQLNIIHPSPDNYSSLSVAKGSLGLLSQEDLVQERKLRRAFAVGRHEEVNNIRAYPKGIRYKGEDGRLRVSFTSCLFRAEESYARGAVAYVRGIRVLTEKILDLDGKGWTIVEPILLCPKRAEDHKRVHDERYGICELRNPLKFVIPVETLANFEKERDEETGAEFWEIEYEIEARLGQGNQLEVRFIVPRSGKFDSEVKGQGWGKDYFFQEGKYDVTGNFALFNREEKARKT